MKIEVISGDITAVSVDAIVNAANSSLLGGGGVDGAIHRVGGPAILEACKKVGVCKTGHAVITTAGKLPAKHVIHAVGPVWRGGVHQEGRLLASCYTQSLDLATHHRLHSIAFPNISTGAYGFPKDKAAHIAVTAVAGYSKPTTVGRVIFVCFDEENFKLIDQLLREKTRLYYM